MLLCLHKTKSKVSAECGGGQVRNSQVKTMALVQPCERRSQYSSIFKSKECKGGLTIALKKGA